jgi:hypothetical protein
VLLTHELHGKLPRWGTGITCQTGLDPVGEPAIWIWVEVTDEAVARRKITRRGQTIHELVGDAYWKIGGRLLSFIRFRSPDLEDHQGAR